MVNANSPYREPSALRLYGAQLAQNPLGLMGLVLVLIVVTTAISSPWLAPYDPNQIMIGPRMGSPSSPDRRRLSLSRWGSLSLARRCATSSTRS